MNVAQNLKEILNELPTQVTLVAVSKTRSLNEIKEVYGHGQRDFGENRVQELVSKAEELPDDIQWHQIGHLQSNKVKYIAPFVHLIHSIESKKLLLETNKRAKENDRTIHVLLQFHIATEENKFGFSLEDAESLIKDGLFVQLENIKVKGVMGMATFTNDQKQIRREFKELKNIYDNIKPSFGKDFDTVSMGMSGDYAIAIEEGSTMVRIGSKIFGERIY